MLPYIYRLTKEKSKDKKKRKYKNLQINFFFFFVKKLLFEIRKRFEKLIKKISTTFTQQCFLLYQKEEKYLRVTSHVQN